MFVNYVLVRYFVFILDKMIVLFFFNYSNTFKTFTNDVLQKSGVQEFIKKYNGVVKRINIRLEAGVVLLGSIRFDMDVFWPISWLREEFPVKEDFSGFFSWSGFVHALCANEAGGWRMSYRSISKCKKRFLKALEMTTNTVPICTDWFFERLTIRRS